MIFQGLFFAQLVPGAGAQLSTSSSGSHRRLDRRRPRRRRYSFLDSVSVPASAPDAGPLPPRGPRSASPPATRTHAAGVLARVPPLLRALAAVPAAQEPRSLVHVAAGARVDLDGQPGRLAVTGGRDIHLRRLEAHQLVPAIHASEHRAGLAGGREADAAVEELRA
ncbi:hypothetical protein DL766_002157 [Monosporascus sp. MC13-8B]|uniref:Uncharacterized protein n=1 Tax=Monosporascus cannonballus TaxID=155416 RepID=A0ABY0HGY3_9PEZI|nr:hypothetical protein DL763_007933 [Monosporascus cannonballus]RYO93218.1 hypothetical protein DL762_001167 [Monosporascus cannonballus]RYP36108.1 hypothetical protein DL766_002157 [Monosporascus sp. MC13-8B]